MRNRGIGSDHCAVADMYTLQNDRIRSYPDIAADVYRLLRSPLFANRYFEIFKYMITVSNRDEASDEGPLSDAYASRYGTVL